MKSSLNLCSRLSCFVIRSHARDSESQTEAALDRCGEINRVVLKRCVSVIIAEVKYEATPSAASEQLGNIQTNDFLEEPLFVFVELL